MQKGKLDQTAVEVLVEHVTEIAPKSYPTPNFTVDQCPEKTLGRPQSAVLMLSDTHVGQVIEPDQTLGIGSYNFPLFCRRLHRLERSVFSILQDHTTTKINELVIPMLGDMLHGNLVHSVEAGQKNTLFQQFICAAHVLAQFLQRLSVLAPIRVPTAVGNHPRWGTQHKMPTDNRYSNLDFFLYAQIKALVKDIPRIEICLDKQPFALFQVEGWNFFAGHGDHLRGGDRMLGVPAHAVGRNVSAHSQLAHRVDREAPNYYLFGHLHRPITLPHTNGEVIVNGGFPGVDGFGLMEAFNSSPPLQKFFLVHPKFGRSACYDLRLDFGDNEPHTYSFPFDDQFMCQ